MAVEATENSAPVTDFEWPSSVAIVFGNEVTGINERVLRACDATVRIPMHGYKNSMNVATAFGIVLYEVLRRWKAI